MEPVRRRIMLAGAMTPALWLSSRAFGQSGHYADKVVAIHFGGGATDGHDDYARMLQPYLQKHLGAREVRTVAMPGGGGLKAANYIWRAPADGLQIFFGNASTLILAHLAGSPGATFDPTKFTYLGRVASEPRVLCVGRKSKISDLADLRKLKRPFVYPSQGTDEDFYTMAVLGDVLGFKVKVVTGYEGNADTARAVIKGDGDGHITGWSASRASVRSGDKVPILMVTSLKSPDDSNIPLITEMAPATKRSVVQAMAAILETHRSYMGPPGMDPKAAAAFRAGVNAAMKDPGLQEEAKRNERPIAPMDGTRQQQMIGEIARASAHLAPILKAAVKAIQ